MQLHLLMLLYNLCLTPMRFSRVKAEGQSFYHCVSRVVDGRFIFQSSSHGSTEAERFVQLMRRLEAFSGVRVLTFTVMSNHFHLLCEVPEPLPHGLELALEKCRLLPNSCLRISENRR